MGNRGGDGALCSAAQICQKPWNSIQRRQLLVFTHETSVNSSQQANDVRIHDLKSGGWRRFSGEEIKTIITDFVENNDFERIPRVNRPKRGGQSYFQKKMYNLQCFHLLRHNEISFLN